MQNHPRWNEYVHDFENFVKQSMEDSRKWPISWEERYPCLDDKTPFTAFDRHYVYHTSWAARCVKKISPLFHVDISSSLYFSGIISAFVPVRFFDYRPADLDLDQLVSARANLMNLPFESDSVHSISCMHVIEHIGLGRYGDLIDPLGDSRAMKELQRVVAQGGNLLFVVPVGRMRIMFNAHRIYSYDSIIKEFSNLTLKEFALIRDDNKGGGIINNASISEVNQQDYGCGLFWFQK